jgi:glycosyltransferase involved in cell wall biosynthesis
MTEPARSASVDITVIICTRNRSASLEATLQSLAQVARASLRCELVVADNGSSDRTASVVAASAWPGCEVRLVTEPVAGQARARNAGLRAARGEVIVFTDDDLRFDPGWLGQLCAPILDGRADAVAGKVEFPKALERGWMTGEVRALFCGSERMQDPPDQLVGANMAFHRRVLAQVPGFDPALGPGALGFYDDTLFAWQLLQAGFRLRYEPAARALHHFDEGRLARAALLEMASKHGRSRAHVDYHWRQLSADGARYGWARNTAALFLWRAAHRRHSTEGVDPVEFDRLRTRAYFSQLARLRGSARAYAKHGLRPIAHG